MQILLAVVGFEISHGLVNRFITMIFFSNVVLTWSEFYPKLWSYRRFTFLPECLVLSDPNQVEAARIIKSWLYSTNFPGYYRLFCFLAYVPEESTPYGVIHLDIPGPNQRLLISEPTTTVYLIVGVRLARQPVSRKF